MKRTRWNSNSQNRFIEVLRSTCNVSLACKEIGFSRTRVYELRKLDTRFAEEWDEAEQIAADILEEEAWRRGVHGIEKPIMHDGKLVGVVKEYSDHLLIALLKAHRPEKFSDKPRTSIESGLLMVETRVILRKRHEREASRFVANAESAQLPPPP